MKQDELNFVRITETGRDQYRNGKLIATDEGACKTLYIGHRENEEIVENGEATTFIEAYPVRVDKPVTRDKAINAAEMQAYDLITALDVASFGTSLSRKYRENPDDAEVADHDEFIAWVKAELTSIGL